MKTYALAMATRSIHARIDWRSAEEGKRARAHLETVHRSMGQKWRYLRERFEKPAARLITEEAVPLTVLPSAPIQRER